MRCIKFASYVCGVVLLASALSPPNLSAQTPSTGFNLVTSPLPINLSVKPGSTVTTDIRLKNGGTETEQLKADLMKFSAYGEEGKPSIQDRAPGDDYFDWVRFSPSTFDAPPNQWITVKMTITVPKSAAFGYYYAAVFSRATPPVKTSSRQNVLIGSSAVLVLLDVQSPNAKRVATIRSFTADKKFYEFLPAEFSLKIKNSGNVHLIPTGNIFISKGKKQIASLSVNEARGNVLPASNRTFTAVWTDGFPYYVNKELNGKVVLDKNDKPVQQLKWDYAKIPDMKFGRYTARMVLAYDDGRKDVPLEATVSFWVIPLRVYAILFIFLVLPTALFVFLFIKYRRLKKTVKK